MVNPIITTIILLVAGIVIGINFYLQNFLASFISVKIKRENGVMVGVFGKRGLYFRPGKITEDDISFKLDRKTKALVKHSKAMISRALGINWVFVEEGTNRAVTAIENKEFKGTPSDSVATDNLLVRALHKPHIKTVEDRLHLLLLLGIAAVTLFIAWKVMNIHDLLRAGARAGGTVITGGNV